MTKQSDSDDDLMFVSDVPDKDIQWLWYPYIPYGNTTMIFGPGGHGKSFLSAALAAAVSTGKPLPGMEKGFDPQNVLMLSAEDDIGAVIKPRLRELGADINRIMVPRSTFELTVAEVKRLHKHMRDKALTLVTIDPMVAYMGARVDMNRMNEVRGLLKELQHAAQETDTALVLFHHSRKQNPDKQGSVSLDYEQAAGSVDFINAVRSALYVTRSNDGTGNVLKHVKSNYAPLGDSIGFEFGEDPTFRWGQFYTPGGEPIGKRNRVPNKRNACANFIKKMLTNGPMASQEVRQAAEKEGYSHRLIYLAAEGLVETHFRKGEDGHARSWWHLKAEKPTGEALGGRREKQKSHDRMERALARRSARLNAASGGEND